jgi:hypothetical protein
MEARGGKMMIHRALIMEAAIRACVPLADQ